MSRRNRNLVPRLLTFSLPTMGRREIVRQNNRMIIVCVLVSALASAQTTAAVVYDNLSVGPPGQSGVTLAMPADDALQRGDEVTLAGTERTVTHVEVAVAFISDFFPPPVIVQTDLRLRLYTVDGLGSAPTTLLWDSGPVPTEFPAQDLSATHTFDVPGVTVPDTIVWTLEFVTDNRITEHFHRFGGVPVVGSTSSRSWQRTGNAAWEIFNQENTLSFPGARIIAVPEPSTPAVMVGLLTCAMLLRHRPHRIGVLAINRIL